ncbi:MAG TPA: hypothetical protein VEX38_05685 [Fimbriimonadaceae bacterium]|nr:hypothetical protein [Fimbriimonadaceae bacterium]
MTEPIMRRLHGVCQLSLLLERVGIPFPSSGDLLFPDGMASWTRLDSGELYVLITFTGIGKHHEQGFRRAALALSLLSFVAHVPYHDWSTTTFIECLVELSKITTQSIAGMTGEPYSSLNLRAHMSIAALSDGVR